MIVGRDQRRARLGLKARGDRLAVFLVAIVGHHLAAIPLGGRALGRRRVQRHDDGGRYAPQARGQRDRLGMVARGEREHPGAPLFGCQPRDRVIAAAKLERPHALEVLAFEIDPRAGARIGGGGDQDRRTMRGAMQSFAGGDNIGIGWAIRATWRFLGKDDMAKDNVTRDTARTDGS